ncbi:MAG: hypothetical protein LBQ31_00200 [Bacteroidales bacterium]|nr:hypothetical protein [Bacteroidales bacterium]
MGVPPRAEKQAGNIEASRLFMPHPDLRPPLTELPQGRAFTAKSRVSEGR